MKALAGDEAAAADECLVCCGGVDVEGDTMVATPALTTNLVGRVRATSVQQAKAKRRVERDLGAVARKVYGAVTWCFAMRVRSSELAMSAFREIES